MASGGLARQEIKMAMAMEGRRRHYRWSNVQARHWTSTAEAAHFSSKVAREIVEECAARADEVVSSVAGELPLGFPPHVAEPILDGVRAAARKLQ